MTEYKSIKEIAEGNPFPFTVVSASNTIFVVTGISPRGFAVGWCSNTGGTGFSDASLKEWKLVTPKKKLLEIMIIQNGCHQVEPFWFASEEKAKKFCEETGVEFVKVLREVEID